MRVPSIVPLLLALSAAAPAHAAAQVVTGRVVASGDSAVAGARVRLVPERGDTVETVADSVGRFVLRPAAFVAFRLAVEARGMREVEPDERFRLGEGDSLDVRMRLAADTVAGEPLQVVAAVRLTPALRAFYARAAADGFGWFVTRDQIDARHAVRTTDLLRRAPGLALVSARGAFGYGLRGRGGCTPTVYVDGGRVTDGASAIDFWTQPSDLEGIEVYTDASAPPEYGGSRSNCTIILLWTRIQ